MTGGTDIPVCVSDSARNGVTVPHLKTTKLSCLIAACLAAPALGQLRVVTMNSSNFDSANSGPRTGMSTILSAIGSTVSDDPTRPGNSGIARPIDVLCLQEVNAAATTGAAYAALLNSIYSTNTYSFGTLNGATTGNGTQGIIYNNATVQLLGSATIGVTSISGMPRQELRYQLRPVGYSSAAADFYIYNGHWKSSSGDQARRLVEAQTIKANAATLPANSNVIYLGDMNVFGSTDDGYEHLMAAGVGQAFDPIATPGSWDGSATFKNVHTQSPWDASLNPGFNGATGGMDSRFDQQIVTANLNDAEGVAYITNSYFVMGNNGSHQLDQPLTTGTGAAPAVLAALASILDHLPVSADYQLPAKMAFTKTIAEPAQVIVGGSATATFKVQNTAPVLTANGADELDYLVSTSGNGVGSFSSTTNTTNAGNNHIVALSTSTPGVKSAIVSATASSQAAEGAAASISLSTTVLAHATPSFDPAVTTTTRTIDFGIHGRGEAIPAIQVLLNNRADPSGFTAGLDLDSVNGTGSTAQLALAIAAGAPSIAAGANREGSVSFASGTIGSFSSTYSLATSDQDLPGAINLSALTLNLTGRIALPGDANLDNAVNLDDFTILASSFGSSGQIWQSGEFTHDGSVTLDDFTLLAANFGAISSDLPRSAIPEPTGIALIASSAVLLSTRHPRRAVSRRRTRG